MPQRRIWPAVVFLATQDSIGGNSRTTVMLCVSPAAADVDDTLTNLRYGQHMLNISNKPVVNRISVRRAAPASAPGLKWAHPAHICAGTGLTPPTSAPGLDTPCPRLRRDPAPRCHIQARTGAHRCHIQARTGAHRHAHRCHLCRGLNGLTPRTSAPWISWAHPPPASRQVAADLGDENEDVDVARWDRRWYAPRRRCGKG